MFNVGNLLAGVNYDPSTAVSISTASLLAMTAIDATNLSLTFTAPANGCVFIRIRCSVSGANLTTASVLLGVLEGSTVVARKNPLYGSLSASSASNGATELEALFAVSGISAGSHTYNAAYAVQSVQASTNISYGGPNDNSGSDAWGGFQFEIWEAPNLLASKLYDPSVAASKSAASLLAMTALDTSNLRLTFTAPPSGTVLVRLGCFLGGASTYSRVLLGILSGSSVVGRTGANKAYRTAASAQLGELESQFIVSGLSGSYTWDAAYAVQATTASCNIKYGGPNNNSGANAWGAFVFEIWAVSALPGAAYVYSGENLGDGINKGTLHASNISTAAGSGVNLSVGILQTGNTVDDVTGTYNPPAPVIFVIDD